MQESLKDETRRLLRECGLTVPEVYHGLASQGSKITYYWLRKFSSGSVKDPSVNRVEELYRYLLSLPKTETHMRPEGHVTPPWVKQEPAANVA